VFFLFLSDAVYDVVYDAVTDVFSDAVTDVFSMLANV